jgi:hypothetical protein
MRVDLHTVVRYLASAIRESPIPWITAIPIHASEVCRKFSGYAT